MNWIFNSNRIGHRFDDRPNQKISFSQKRKFYGEIGENVIIIESKYKNWVFSKYFTITDIEQQKQEDGYTKITISLELKSTFNEDKSLEDYSYSLVRVTNFREPFMQIPVILTTQFQFKVTT